MDSKERDSLKVGQKLYGRQLKIYGNFIEQFNKNTILVGTQWKGKKVEQPWKPELTDIVDTCQCPINILMIKGCQCGKI